jgi:PAS domain S-box-containing protein
MVLQALEELSVDTSALEEGLGVSQQQLRDPSERIPWDTFAALLDRVKGRYPSEDLGAALNDTDAWAPARRLAGLVVSPAQALAFGTRLLGPSYFPTVRADLTRYGGGRLELRLSLPADARGSRPFFELVLGMVRDMPRLFDLPPADVEARLDTHHARLVIRMPEPGLARIATRVFGSAASLRDLWELTVHFRRDLEESHAAIERHQDGFQRILAHLPEGVAVLRGSSLLYTNATLLQMLGAPHAEPAASSFREIAPHDAAVRIEQAIKRLRERPDSTSGEEIRIPKSTGDDAVLELLPLQPLDFDNKPANLLVVRDVTSRRQLQQQLMLADRMASLGTVAASVGHEINNPLGYISVSLQTIARQLRSLDAVPKEKLEGIHKALEAARQGTERVTTIVRDLKTFSRPDEEAVHPVDVHDVLESAVNVADRELREKATLVRHYGTNVPAVLANDPRVGQVFLNLLVNAAQAFETADPSKNQVRIHTTRQLDGWVQIEVADNGPGIPREALDQVFLPFFTTKPAGVGTGLGLPICHRIVQRFGGRISLDSRPGGGTTVQVFLPSVEVGRADEEPTLRFDPSTPHPLRPRAR